MIIWGLIIWMIYEGIMRIIHPVQVQGKIMLGTSIFGFVCNVIMIKIMDDPTDN